MSIIPGTDETLRRRRWLWTAALLLALATALISAAPYLPTAPLDLPRTCFETPAPGMVPGLGTLSVSPDGQRIAYIAVVEGKRAVWIRLIGAAAAQQLDGTANAVGLFWSPDSRYLAFIADGKLKKMDVPGGPAQALCDASIVPTPGAWSRGGAILFTARGKSSGFVMGRISALGGDVRLMTMLDSSRQEVLHIAPQFLADGRHFLYHGLNAAQEVTLYLGSLDSRSGKPLMGLGTLAAGSPALYVAPGYLLFRRNRTLMAQPFDENHLALAGEAVPLAESVASGFSASENGVLVYRSEMSPETITVLMNWSAGLKK